MFEGNASCLVALHYSRAPQMQTTTAACLEYGDICISEASGIFLMGVAMCICAAC